MSAKPASNSTSSSLPIGRKPIDFMRYRRVWVGVSALVIAASLVWWLVGPAPNLGIELAGGSQLTVRFREQPDLGKLRQTLADAGLAAQIQQFGNEAEHTLLIRVASVASAPLAEQGLALAALDGLLQPELRRDTDLNRLGMVGVAELLAAGGLSESDAADAAESLRALRTEEGVVSDWAQIESRLAGPAFQILRSETSLGAFALLGSSGVSSQVSVELAQRAFLAVAAALGAMMIYIWFRFDLAYGVGAVMASLHDVLVATGLFVALGFEINLTTVAALLTLVGYSVNDTVVVCDRVRENRRANPRLGLEGQINLSVTQTLSRTFLTSGTTLAAALPLLFFGGETLRGFAFLIAVGVIVGTYSTIYIAGPFALLFEQAAHRRRRARAGDDDAADGAVRRPSQRPASAHEGVGP